MRTRMFAICAAAIAFAATSVSAQQPQSNTVGKEKPKTEKKICKWLPATGSNRVERHCLTAEEWKKAEALSW